MELPRSLLLCNAYASPIAGQPRFLALTWLEALGRLVVGAHSDRRSRRWCIRTKPFQRSVELVYAKNGGGIGPSGCPYQIEEYIVRFLSI